MTATARLSESSDSIGPRADAWDKVTGAAKYTEDLPEPDGTVYGVSLRSRHPHARIIAIDSSEAEAVPGVLGILDRRNLGDLDRHVYLDPRGLPGSQPLIAADVARFEGDLIGMIVATDAATASHAARKVRIEYDPLSAIVDADDALAPDTTPIHDQMSTNLAWSDTFEWGSVEEGLAVADHVFEETFYSPTVFHHPMEPVSSFIAALSPKRADLVAPVQYPFAARDWIARAFSMPATAVSVNVPYIGGGFGARPPTPEMIVALALSRRIGRPIKVCATAEESFRQNARHGMSYKAVVGVTKHGRLTGLDVSLVIDTGAYLTSAENVTHNGCISAWGCYRIPHFRARAATAFTNRVPAGHFRATGKTQTTFGIECTMDSVARRLGIPPIDLRKRNVLAKGERIAKSWVVGGRPYTADAPPIDADLAAMLDRAVQALDAQTPQDAGDGSSASVGRGVALSLRHGSSGGGVTRASVSLDAAGHLTVHHNAPDLGSGVLTVIRAVASRVTGLSPKAVTVLMPSTANGLPFSGTTTQRTTVQMGNAVADASRKLRARLLHLAASVWGGTAGEWDVASGRVVRGDSSYPIGDLVVACGDDGPISSTGSYSFPESQERAFRGVDGWAAGAAAVDVSVDTESGQINILRYSIVGDVGHAIHPAAAIGQLEGGAIMGMGLSLMEEVGYGADGHLLNGTPAGYRVPTARWIPPIATTLIENGDGPGPFGAKGLAQTSIPCVTPAVNNAVCDAVGFHLSSSPFTPEKVLTALRKRGVPATGIQPPSDGETSTARCDASGR